MAIHQSTPATPFPNHRSDVRWNDLNMLDEGAVQTHVCAGVHDDFILNVPTSQFFCVKGVLEVSLVTSPVYEVAATTVRGKPSTNLKYWGPNWFGKALVEFVILGDSTLTLQRSCKEIARQSLTNSDRGDNHLH